MSDENIYSDNQTHEVRERTLAAALWSISWVVGKQGITILVVGILARFITPEDYGLVGMAMTLTLFLGTFSHLGLTYATMQKSQLQKQLVDNLFWINISFGFFLAGVTVLVAPHLADFYKEDALVMLTAAYGGIFVLQGLSAQTSSLIYRKLKHKKITIVDLLSQVLAAAVAIYAAISGMKYWALVIQSYLSEGIRAILLFYISGYRPGLPRSGAGTRKMISFGGVVSIYSVFIYFSRNLDNILIGKFWGPKELGFYGRAYLIMMMPSALTTGALANVMIPALSSLREDRLMLADHYRKSLKSISFFALPTAIGIGLVSEEAVMLVYGADWLPVAPILFWLTLSGAIQPIYNTNGWLFFASGNMKQMLYWGIISTAILASAFYFSVSGGALGVSKAYSFAVVFLLFIPGLYWAHRTVGIKLSNSLEPLAPIFVCTLVMGASVYVLAGQLEGLEWYFRLPVKMIVGALTYAISSLFLVHPLPQPQLAKFQAWVLGKK